MGLFAVDGDPMTGQLRGFSAGARRHGQRVSALCVGDFANHHDLFQLADAADSELLVRGREAGWKSIPAERLPARIQKHDIVGHQGQQADKITGVDRIHPMGMQLTDSLFIGSHLPPPLLDHFDHATLWASVLAMAVGAGWVDCSASNHRPWSPADDRR